MLSLSKRASIALGVGFCAAVLAGCGGDKPPGVGATSAGAGSVAAVQSAAPAELHGIFAIADQVEQGGALDVFDPRTGKLLKTLPSSFAMAQDAVFSPDWRLVATDQPGTGGEHGIILGRRSGDSYEQIGRWEPQAAVEGGSQQYGSPTFNPQDGRLWYAQRSVNQGPSNSDVWFSVDPGNPGAAPRQELHAPPVVDSAGAVVQPATAMLGVDKATAGSKATVTAAGGELLSAQVEGGWPPATNSFNQFLLYRCDQPITPQKLLCVGENGQDAAGSVLGLSVPAGGKKAVLRQIFPPAAGGGTLLGAWLSPDRASVLLRTGNAWFVGPATGSAAPAQAFADLGAETVRVLGWF